MSNRRMITSDMLDDEWYGALGMMERALWVGLMVSADDQGRMLANESVIRAHVFPYDDIAVGEIGAALQGFAAAGKVWIYEGGGKRLLQLVNWWKHQRPTWASPSQFPAPEGWMDRVKAHGAGNKVISRNWDQPGGWLHSELSGGQDSKLDSALYSGLDSNLYSGLDSAIDELRRDESESEIKGEKREEERAAVNAEAGQNVPAGAETLRYAAAPKKQGESLRIVNGSAVAMRLLSMGAGMPAPPPSWNGKSAAIEEVILSLYDELGEEATVAKIREVVEAWKARSYNITNPGWVDWLVGGIPGRRAAEGVQSDDVRSQIRRRIGNGNAG